MNLAEELKKVINGDVLTDEATLATYSRDASLFVVNPQVVVFPKDSEDVKNLVRFVSERKKTDSKISLTGRSAGTDMGGGPLSESIVVAFGKYFTHMSVDPASKTATTEPGVFYRNFEVETLKEGLLFPTYPASRQLCAMGGIVNNNSAGEKTLEYGQTKDFIEEISLVCADGNEYTFKELGEGDLNKKMQNQTFEGEIYRKMYALITENNEVIRNAKPKTSKNAAGYFLWEVWNPEKKIFNLAKLITGAQGTLGLVTRAKLRLITPKKRSQMIILFLDKLDNLGDLVNAVLAQKPSTFESYDDKTLKLAIKFFWEFLRRLGLKNIFTIAVNGIGTFFSIVTHGLPKLVLQITFDGDDKNEIRTKALALAKDLSRFKPRYLKVLNSEKEAEEYWLIRRESFALLRSKVKDKKTAPFIDDVVVNPDRLPEFLPRLNAILDQYDIVYTVAGHIGNGNFHIIPLMKLEEESQRKIIPELADKVYNLVLEFGGSITAEHNDGLIRSPYLKQMYGDKMYSLFEETKKIFDPDNIFNPGKKVGSDMQYAINHIRRS